MPVAAVVALAVALAAVVGLIAGALWGLSGGGTGTAASDRHADSVGQHQLAELVALAEQLAAPRRRARRAARRPPPPPPARRRRHRPPPRTVSRRLAAGVVAHHQRRRDPRRHHHRAQHPHGDAQRRSGALRLHRRAAHRDHDGDRHRRTLRRHRPGAVQPAPTRGSPARRCCCSRCREPPRRSAPWRVDAGRQRPRHAANEHDREAHQQNPQRHGSTGARVHGASLGAERGTCPEVASGRDRPEHSRTGDGRRRARGGARRSTSTASARSPAGTIAWGVALVACLVLRDQLADTGRTWWLWVCVAGIVLGLAGVVFVRRRAAVYRAHAAEH